MSRIECGRKWASFWWSILLQWFGNLPLKNYRTLIKWQNIWLKNTMAIPEKHKVMQHAGPWLLFIRHCSILDSTLRRRRKRKTDQKALKLCSWTRETTCAGSSHPYTEEKIQDQISLHSEGWRGSRALTTNGRGRARDNHLIPVPG